MKQDAVDRRECIRLDYRVSVELQRLDRDEVVIPAEMVDVSVYGMRVKIASKDCQALHCSENYRLRIILPGQGSRLIIDDLRSRVIRVEECFIGLHFNEPLDWFLLFNVYKAKQLRG